MSSEAQTSSPCPYCGMRHEFLCPRIKAVDLREDGVTWQRIEFHPVAMPDLPPAPETDESLRARLLAVCTEGSMHHEAALTAAGADLDLVASLYDVRRGGAAA